MRRLRETRGQTTVEWMVAMVLVTALATGLVAALPATAGAILDRFGCLVGKAVGRGCDATSGTGSGGVAAQPTFGDGPRSFTSARARTGCPRAWATTRPPTSC